MLVTDSLSFPTDSTGDEWNDQILNPVRNSSVTLRTPLFAFIVAVGNEVNIVVLHVPTHLSLLTIYMSKDCC